MTATDTTFTAEELASEVKKAVDAAVEPLNARIAELSDAAGKTELETAVADATAELTAQVEQLTKDVEAADAAKKDAEDALAAKVAEDEQKEKDAALDTRRDERSAFVKGLGLFSDDLVEKSKDRWAAMVDDDWEAQKAEYEEAAARKGIKPQPLPQGGKPAAVTATAADEGTKRVGSAVREVMELRKSGINPRHISVS